jgi:hypothetical protein
MRNRGRAGEWRVEVAEEKGKDGRDVWLKFPISYNLSSKWRHQHLRSDTIDSGVNAKPHPFSYPFFLQLVMIPGAGAGVLRTFKGKGI